MQTFILRGDLFWQFSNLLQKAIEMRSAEDNMANRAAVRPRNKWLNEALTVKGFDLPIGCPEVLRHVAKRDRGLERFDQGNGGRRFKHYAGAFDLCRMSRNFPHTLEETRQTFSFHPDSFRQAVQRVESPLGDFNAKNGGAGLDGRVFYNVVAQKVSDWTGIDCITSAIQPIKELPIVRQRARLNGSRWRCLADRVERFFNGLSCSAAMTRASNSTSESREE